MLQKKILNTILLKTTPDQEDLRGHCLFDRNKQKNKVNKTRAVKNAAQIKFENLLLGLL